MAETNKPNRKPGALAIRNDGQGFFNKKPMPRIIKAITVNTKPLRFVSSTQVTEGNKVVVETTTDPDQAMDFGSGGYAESIIPRIKNPLDRVFEAISIEVSDKKRVAADSELL